MFQNFHKPNGRKLDFQVKMRVLLKNCVSRQNRFYSGQSLDFIIFGCVHDVQNQEKITRRVNLL